MISWLSFKYIFFKRLALSNWISQHDHNRISTKKHLWNKSISVHRLWLCLSLDCSWHFSPQFLHMFQHHIAVSIERLYSSQQFMVISAVNEDLIDKNSILFSHLSPVNYRLFEYGQWTCGVVLLCFFYRYTVYVTQPNNFLPHGSKWTLLCSYV